MAKKFSAKSVTVMNNFGRRVIREGASVDDAKDLVDPGTIVAIFEVFKTLFGFFKELCPGKTPPTPPPVPAELAAAGVPTQVWKDTYIGNWLATEAWNGTKYRTPAVNHAAKELGERNGTNKKLQKPAAIAGFDTMRKEKPEDIALMVHEGS